MGKRLRRDFLAFIAVLIAYYAAPIGELPSRVGIVFSVLGLLVGLTILVWLIIRQVRLLVDTDPDDTSVQADSLILLVFVIVPLFSIGYLALSKASPSEFADLSTKTDSLYFTLSTLATVGFGDVHAVGQLARVLVMIQMVFDLVFVAAVVSVLSSHIRQRAAIVVRQRSAAEAELIEDAEVIEPGVTVEVVEPDEPADPG
jgi:voltage-gated potassium channel